MTGAEDVRERIDRAVTAGISSGQVSLDELEAILDDARDRLETARDYQEGSA